LTKLVGQLADMHQPVLVHPDIDKGAEGRDVGDRAFQQPCRVQVLDLLDALGEGRGA
jgi:hypothetical protein